MLKGAATSVASRAVRVGLATMLAGLALAGCGGDGDDTQVLSESAVNTTSSTPTTSTTTTAAPTTTTTGGDEAGPTPDDTAHEGSRIPCQHYRNIVDGLASGLLTDAQATQRSGTMADVASQATSEVQEGAEAMADALEQADADAYVASVNQLGDACAAAGH